MSGTVSRGHWAKSSSTSASCAYESRSRARGSVSHSTRSTSGFGVKEGSPDVGLAAAQ